MNYEYEVIGNIEDIHGEHIYSKIKYVSSKTQNYTQSRLNKIVDEISENTKWDNPWQELIFRISMGYERKVSRTVLDKLAKRQEEQRRHDLKTQAGARTYYVD